MGESRESSESRGYSTPSYSKSYYVEPSESREKSSESRDGLTYRDWLNTDPWIARGGLSSEGEMRQAYNEWLREKKGQRRSKSSSIYSSSQSTTKKYNSIEDVDKLIKKLESTKDVESNSPAVNEALQAKRKKLEELKELVAQAKAAEAEKKLLESIQRDSDELDRAIKGIKGRKR